jgi:type IX secretion system PorP/SprF family membrane protein
MKKIILSSILVVSIGNLIGQQLGQYSQYINNHFLMNPAAVGAEDGIDISLGFRQQWVGIDNAPQNYYLTVNSPLNIGGAPKVNSSLRTGSAELIQNEESSALVLKHGVGGYIAADNYGPFKKISGVLAYAIHLPIAQKFHWSIGLNAGLSNLNFDRNQITLIESTDNTFNSFAASQGRINYVDMNIGTYVYNKDFFVGYSSNQMMQNKIYFGGVPTNGKLNVHHFLMGGYHFKISDKMKLTPGFLVKYMNPAPVSLDLTAKLTFDDTYFGGFSFRNGDAVIVMLGAKFNDMFRIGYSFDYTLSNLSDYNSGGHEIIIGILIK